MITMITFDDRDFRPRYSLFATRYCLSSSDNKQGHLTMSQTLTHLTPFRPVAQNRVFIRNMATRAATQSQPVASLQPSAT
jgi:hypothetical protein